MRKRQAAVKSPGRRLTVTIIVILILVALGLIWHVVMVRWPDPELDAFREHQYSTRFYDREGVLLHVMPLDDGLRREYYPLEAIPKELVERFISEEDAHFYHHPGVDFLSVIRAWWQNKKAGQVVSGASTITMQLVRMVHPRQEEVGIKTKIREMFRAFSFEAKLSKKEILELYLNNVPFGFQIEGVGSASRSFYGVEPKDLSDEQIDSIVKIPRRPSEYAPKKTYDYKTQCPHFIVQVVSDYKEKNQHIPPEVTLSVDSDLNIKVEKLIQAKLSEYKEARVHNGAAFVINNHTGEIIVWVGNASFDDVEHSGQIDGVLVKNQPGSSMKPFLYALALESGFSPSSVLPDIQMDFGGEGVYVPLNFNNMFNGPVLFRNALASSLNVPAVYLLYNVGMDNYLERLDMLGFESLAGKRDSMGLSLALGAGEVSLYEMVRGFSVFTNDGKLMEDTTCLKTDQKASLRKVYAPDTARIICSILSDKNARSLGFGNAQVFDTDYPCIFKTGTSNQFQNIIALGSTSEFTAGVWMGNYEGETVVRQTGSSIPASVVRQILDELTDTYGALEFLEPELYEKKQLCALSGMKPSSCCPSKINEYVLKNSNEDLTWNTTCTWHHMNNGKVAISYPSEYQHWSNGRNYAGTISGDEADVEIRFPRNKASFVYDPLLPKESQMLHVLAVGGGSSVTSLYLDGNFVGSVQGILEWDIPLERGVHSLMVTAGNSRDVVTYTVQ
ncbi:MAG: transglycosylase domain-containing protein [Treponema sp.]|nr:transglycosylase domain-containing protein [Treponema sp.]